MKQRIQIMRVPEETVKTIRRVHDRHCPKKALKIGLLKMGGLGDAMTLKAFAKKVKEKHPDAFVTVIMRSFNEIFDSPKFADNVVQIPGYEWRELYLKLKDEFDIFYDVGYVVRTVINKYNDRRVWDQLHANNRLLDFYPLWYKFPFSNDLLTDIRYSIFDIMNMTSGYDVSESDMEITTVQTDIPKAKYVTLHNGAGGKAFVKIAPMKLFGKIAKFLRNNGYVPVQIGYKDDVRIPNTEDYRGKSLGQTSFIIENAQFHVDVESGTAYLARAVKTPAIILFGATPIHTFGFSHNCNLSRNKCTACWWWNNDYMDKWYEKCRKGHKYCRNIPNWRLVKPALLKFMENNNNDNA